MGQYTYDTIYGGPLSAYAGTAHIPGIGYRLKRQSVKDIAQRIRMSYRQNALASASDATMVLYVGAGG